MSASPVYFVQKMHASFDAAHTDCCPERWPRLLDLLRQREWSQARAQIGRWVAAGILKQPESAELLASLGELEATNPATMF